MTDKTEMFLKLIAPQTEKTELIEVLLEQAKQIVLNRRYPFGYSETLSVPPQYEAIQVRIAVELYAKMGAEGEVSHQENGIKRDYAGADISPALLNQIIPFVGTVRQ